jgi:uncharacterized circularly permuted ATP-grasp superfamily protein/uncharacterized alpha-E superfamily protein
MAQNASSLFDREPTLDASARAAMVALPKISGHFDELRGQSARLRAPWIQFFNGLGSDGFADLDHRLDNVGRQIRENGITYNVYADASGTSRPWSLDLLPFLIEYDEWQALAAGVEQRARLMNATLADVYGEGRVVREGLLPAALVQGHPGYLRSVHGFLPPGGVHLHIAAFDLARAPDGSWWTVGQRIQAPSGLGYVLENRLTISRQFPAAFRDLHIQHLAGSYKRMLEALSALAPDHDGQPRIVLLTPGPFNETYFEHAYLARYLGLPLVEGSDLTVRDDRVYLKALHGLERVHGILRRLDDDFIDPLELRSDSTLGVPGLLQAMRAGHVLIANAPGAGFLESPAVSAFFPKLCQALLGEALLLPTLESWWCGEAVVREQVLPKLRELVVKPTYPRGGFEAFLGADASEEELGGWRRRIEEEPAAFTLQSYLPLSQAPTWNGGQVIPRAAMVRVFALSDGKGNWHALPGGMTRIANRDRQIVSMQRGGSSLDTWVMTPGKVDAFSMLPEHIKPEDLAAKRRPVSSRAAENLFWMGRYAERAENTVRLARLTLYYLTRDDAMPAAFVNSIGELCIGRGLVPEEVAPPAHSPRVFERALIAALADTKDVPSVGFDVRALGHAAGHIRDRLSPAHWRLILAAGDDLFAELGDIDASSLTPADAIRALEHLGVQLTAITGAQTDRMTRDDGWRLMTIGRQIERLCTMASTIGTLFREDAIASEQGFDLLLELFDSIITYRAHYQRRHETAALIDLLVMDLENPRSLACALDALQKMVGLLPLADGLEPLDGLIDAGQLLGNLVNLCQRDEEGIYQQLITMTEELYNLGRRLSDEISRRYFTHAQVSRSLVA